MNADQRPAFQHVTEHRRCRLSFRFSETAQSKVVFVFAESTKLTDVSHHKHVLRTARQSGIVFASYHCVKQFFNHSIAVRRAFHDQRFKLQSLLQSGEALL